MSLTPSQHEPDHETSSHNSRESVPKLKVLTPYDDELSIVYPPESLKWRDLPDERANRDNGVANEAGEAFTLKKLPCFSELLDWRDLYDLKLTCDDVANKCEKTSAQLRKLHHQDWSDHNNEQETSGDTERSQNVFFDKTERDHQRSFKRAKNFVDVRTNDEDEITKSLLQKYIKESSLKIDGAVKHDDKHWSSLLGESKSFSQLVLENQTNQPKEEPSSPGLLSWLLGWWSFLWNKVGFLKTQNDSSLQISNSSESPRNRTVSRDNNIESQSVPPEELRSLQTPPLKDLSE